MLHLRSASQVFLAVALVALATPSQSSAQLALNNLPNADGNSRFFTDRFPIKHPSLSLNGFDCGSQCGRGLGLRQVLNEAYGAPREEVLRVLIAVVNLATDGGYIAAPTSYAQVRSNTERLQARAFVALASYVLDRNGINPTGLNPALPAPQTALNDLRAALLNVSSWSVDKAKTADAMKWATPMTNVARAVDLYLALEIAYQYYGEAAYVNPNSTSLLSQANKEAVLTGYHLALWRLEQLGGEGYASLGEWLLDQAAALDAYDVQAGNWPLKVQVALGYGMLTQQNVSAPLGFGLDYSDLVQRAFKAAGKSAGSDRQLYWRFQSSGGDRFWAEGPYYLHLTVSQIVPFWHTARINNLLSNTSVVGYAISGDPFTSTWLTNPLHWLADIATPDGRTPPLDDGNKQTMYNSSILRWTSAYGDASLGRKFAWIHDQAGFGSSPSLLLVELAIPRLTTGGGIAPMATLPISSAVQSGTTGEQALVIRRGTTGNSCENTANPGACHYLLLNGERSDAITRGEGHEQPDQLQLLYYVDDVSYLVDSGYDDAHFPSNSTWNYYQDHNVMQAYPSWYASVPERPSTLIGGARPPTIVPFRKNSDHNGVSDFHRSTHGNIELLQGKIVLRAHKLSGSLYDSGTFRRSVLFIGGTADPYVIDVNMGHQDVYPHPESPSGHHFVMSYHVNSNVVNPRPSQDGFGIWRNVGGSLSALFIAPSSVEREPYVADSYMLHDDEFAETYSVDLTMHPIQRLDIQSHKGPGLSFLTPFHTTVAFIKALPDGPTPGLSAPLPWATATVPPGEFRPFQAWIWQLDANTLDVFAARSGRVYLPSTRTDVTFPIAQAGGIAIVLPADRDYGFVRLVKDGGDWIAQSGYLLNFSIPPPPAPLAASITGPSKLSTNQSGTWTASVSGGVQPYNYKWEICDESGSGPTFAPLDSDSAFVGVPSNEGTKVGARDPEVPDTSPLGPSCPPGSPAGTGSSVTYQPAYGFKNLYVTLTVWDSRVPAQFVTDQKVVPPSLARPTLLSPANGSTGQPTSVTFKWGAVQGATSYILRVNPNSTTYTEYEIFGATSSTKTVPAGDKIWWQVCGKNGQEEGLWASSWYFYTASAPPPPLDPPVLLTPANAANSIANPVKFSWQPLSGANHYILRVNPNCADVTEYTIYGTSATKAVPNCKVWWQARGVDAYGTPGTWTQSWYFWPAGGASFADGGADDSTGAVAGKASESPASLVDAATLLVPSEVFLDESYPNPFNPVTRIRYALPDASAVTLTVYDVRGRAVAILVNNVMSAGYHEVEFDGSDLPSGVYLYRMTAGSFTQTKKLLLAK